MSHSEQHEELLARVVSGELERSDERVLAVVHACARCRSDLDELLETLDVVRGAGQQQREAFAEARTSERAIDTDWARRTLATRGVLPARRTRRRAWLVLASAAAVALTLTLWRRSRAEPGPIVLGEGLVLVRPVGASADLGLFSWRFDDLPGSGYYALRVWERLEQGGERQLFEQLHLDTNTWQAAPGSIGSARSIRWSVDAYDAGGELLDSDSALAELSP